MGVDQHRVSINSRIICLQFLTLKDKLLIRTKLNCGALACQVSPRLITFVNFSVEEPEIEAECESEILLIALECWKYAKTKK